MKTIATELSAKQHLFCDEYLIDRNATAAALRAGYSESTASGGYLMVIPKIKWYIEERTQATAQKLRVNHEMILDELCKIAFGNIGNFFGADGALKPMHEVDVDDKAALWSLSVSDAGSGTRDTRAPADGLSTTKLRMYNKLSALDKIAKHIGFYKPEIRLPDKEYIYLNDADINKYDCFDDDTFIYDEEESGSEVSGTRETPAPEVEKETVDEPFADIEPVVVVESAVVMAEEPAPVLPAPPSTEGRFRGAIAMPKRELTDEELLHASLNKALKSYDAKNYTNLSVTQKTRLLWRLRKFE